MTVRNAPQVWCPDTKTETLHDPHWHVIRAGNITVAQGQCEGVQVDYYYAYVDDNGILCVDQVQDAEDWRTWTEEEIAAHASAHPRTVYFTVVRRSNLPPGTRDASPVTPHA